jgi:hypothetical protein
MRVRALFPVPVLGLFPVLLLGSLFFGCSESGRATGPWGCGDPRSYPDTLRELDSDSLVRREAAFNTRNPSVCEAMDAFGRLRSNLNCPVPEGEEVADSAAAAGLALAFLQQNREFFYISGDLPALRLTRHRSDGIWVVVFALQQVDGCEVEGSQIILWVKNQVCAAFGGHVPGYCVPATSLWSVERARAAQPATIAFGCWTTYHAVLGQEGVKVGFPFRLYGPGGQLAAYELRTAYRFTYYAGGLAVEDVYVDVMSGELLEVVPRIIC